MDELEVEVIAFLQERHRPMVQGGQMSKSAVDIFVRDKAGQLTPLVRANRQLSGHSGPLTEDEMTSAQLELSALGLAKTERQIHRALAGNPDPLRKKMLEAMLLNMPEHIEKARTMAAQPSAITEADVQVDLELKLQTPRAMMGALHEAARERILALARNGHATIGDDLFMKFDEMKAMAESVASPTTPKDGDTLLRYRTLQAEFYGLLKRREREADHG